MLRIYIYRAPATRMDIRDCIEILKERKGGCKDDTRGFLHDLPAVPTTIPSHIKEQSTLGLVNMILSLQAERVQVEVC